MDEKNNKWEERSRKMIEAGNGMQKKGGSMMAVGCGLMLLIPIIIFIFLLL